MDRPKTFLQALGCVIYPNRCAFCDELIPISKYVCERCEAELPHVIGNICRKCGCERKYCKCGKGLEFDRAVAPLYYAEPFNRGLLKFKKNREDWRAEVFAIYMAGTATEAYAGERIDFAVRVPDHKSRIDDNVRGPRLGAGKSPNATLAKAFCAEYGVELKEGVLRYYSDDSKSQRSRNFNERHANVFGMFDIVDDGCELFGSNVLLIDDVFTTGSTLSECAKMLKLHGAESVFCVTLFTTKQEKRKK
ncbi:MAG: ComF family protein [Clostridia bacterium]|nr:ComF family protein [Clostridia bacterium]